MSRRGIIGISLGCRLSLRSLLGPVISLRFHCVVSPSHIA